MSFSTLSIGTTALRTSQYALDLVGHNIANSSTEGYTRQRVSTSAGVATESTLGKLGTGVKIDYISRVSDDYLDQSVRDANTQAEYYSELQGGYSILEGYFNELTDYDLSSVMDEFWSAANDVANNVEDVSTREVFLETAESLSDVFNSLSDLLVEYKSELNDDVVSAVDQINEMGDQIAELNIQIMKAEADGSVASDLRDDRERVLKELAGIIETDVTIEENGAAAIYIGNRMLVYRDISYELTTETMSVDGVLYDIPVFEDNGQNVEIDSGSLAGAIELRDEIVQSYLDELDELAAGMIWNINITHSQNTGLSGYTEVSGTTTVLNPAETLDGLLYNFNPVEGTFEISNGNLELIVLDTSTNETQSTSIEIDLDGSDEELDTILYDEDDPTAENSLVNMLQAALDDVAAGAFTVSIDNSNRLSITSTNDQYEIGFGEDSSGVLAALGLNTMFTGFDAGTMAVNDSVKENVSLLACSENFTSGDNTGINDIVSLREETLLSNESATFDDFYETSVARLGTELDAADSNYELQSDILEQTESEREELSGVNLDEELADMIQYQMCYQAAARFISTANSIYETLISM